MITIAEIQAAEAEAKRVRLALATIGREIYLIREGEKLGSEYGFTSYIFQTFEGDHFWAQEGPDWGKGTPIISIQFYWGRAENSINVTMPQAWLEADWRQLETARVAAVRAEAERLAVEAAAARKVAHEESERRTFERLQKKFGGRA